jgi:hypothetical protein
MDLKANLFSAYDRHARLQALAAGGAAAAAAPGGGEEAGTGGGGEETVAIARHLGMDESEDRHLMWIAELALKAPLPEDWHSYETQAGELYYHKPETGETSWDHPNDHYFRALYQKTKEQQNASMKMAEAAHLLFRSSIGEQLGPELSPHSRHPYELHQLPISPVLRSPESPGRDDSTLSQTVLQGEREEAEHTREGALAYVLQQVEDQRTRFVELQASVQAIHQAVQSLKEDHHKLKTDNLSSVQRVVQKLQTSAKEIVARLRTIESKQTCDAMFRRLSSNADESWRSTDLSSWRQTSLRAGGDTHGLQKKVTDVQEQLETLKNACRASCFYQIPSVMRWVFYSMVGVHVWIFVCAAVLLAESRRDDGDKSADALDAFRVMQHVGKGVEGLLLVCVFDYLGQLLADRSQRFIAPAGMAKAAMARIVGELSCGIQVLSNLHLAAALVYARKVRQVQGAADASAMTLSPSIIGLRILDGRSAEISEDPAGIAESFLLALSMLLLLWHARNASCEQVPLLVVWPAGLWAMVRFARGIVLTHSLSSFGRSGLVDVEEDDLHGVILSSLQLLECCAGVFAFATFSRFCEESSSDSSTVPKREASYVLDPLRSAAENVHKSSSNSDGRTNPMSFEADQRGSSQSFTNIDSHQDEDPEEKMGDIKQQQPVPLETKKDGAVISEGKEAEGGKGTGKESSNYKLRPLRHLGEDAHALTHLKQGQHKRDATRDTDTDNGQESMHVNFPTAKGNDQKGGKRNMHPSGKREDSGNGRYREMREKERMPGEEEDQMRPSGPATDVHIIMSENRGSEHTNPHHRARKALNDRTHTQHSNPDTTTHITHHTTPHTTPYTTPHHTPLKGNTPHRTQHLDSPQASIRRHHLRSGVKPPPAGRSADAIASQFLRIEAEFEQQSDVRDGDKSVKLSAIHNLAQSFASGECDRNLCL